MVNVGPPLSGFPGQKRSGVQPAPRFGWSQSGHRALESAAVALLPDNSPLKAFLTPERMEQIHAVSEEQDLKYAGENHFLDLEETLDSFRRNPDNRPWDRNGRFRIFKFAVVRDFFHRQNRHSRGKDLEKLSLNKVQNFDNVFTKSMSGYQGLVSIFKMIGAHPEQKRGLLKELVKKLGAVHYWGDLHQPLHLTAFFDWHMKYAGTPMHEFVEKDVMTDTDYQDWKQIENGRIRPGLLTQAKLKDILLGQIRTGYLTIFDWVSLDEGARNQKNLGKEEYREYLRESLKKNLKKRMDEAAINIATMLNSAYQEGGSPDLSLPARQERFS